MTARLACSPGWSSVLPILFVLLCTPALMQNKGIGGQPRPTNLKAEKNVQELIKVLDSSEFSKREAAQRALEKIGEPALMALEKAASSGSAEVARRAGLAIRAIHKTLFFQVRTFEGHRPRGDSGDGVWITRVARTPDGRQALTAGPDGLRLWDIRTGKVILFFGQPQQGETSSWAVGISFDGHRALAGSNAGHTDEVWGVAFLRDGRRAVSASWDTTIRIWDIETGRELRRFSAGDKMRSMALSADGKQLAVGHFSTESQPSTLRLWDLDKGQEIRSFLGHTQAIASVAFSPDGKSLLTASWDKTVRLWNLTSGKEERCAQANRPAALRPAQAVCCASPCCLTAGTASLLGAIARFGCGSGNDVNERKDFSAHPAPGSARSATTALWYRGRWLSHTEPEVDRLRAAAVRVWHVTKPQL